MKMKLAIGVVLALLAFAPSVGATTFGAYYSGGLFYIENLGAATGTDFTVRYTADLTNFTGDNGQQFYLYGVGFRPVPSDIADGEISATTNSTNNWYFYAAELSANGCRNGNTSFACASTWNGSAFQPYALSTVGALGSGPIYTWDFSLHYAGTVTLDLNDVSIKAAFSKDNTGETQRGLMSLTTSEVPEPTSLLLLGSSLLGLGVAARRRKKA